MCQEEDVTFDIRTWSKDDHATIDIAIGTQCMDVSLNFGQQESRLCCKY